MKEFIFNEDIGKYKNVRMDLERGGSDKVNLHLHVIGDKFVYNGTTYVNSSGHLIYSAIEKSKIVTDGYLKAIKYAKKAVWLFP